MANHHFVPRIYLRNFCEKDDGFLYGAKFSFEYKKWQIKKYHINNICYEKDFYKLDEALIKSNNVPDDIIEKKAFGYEPSFINYITERIQSKEITENDLYKLAHFYLSMKHRNPKFRAGFTQQKQLENFDVATNEIRKKFTEMGASQIVIENAIAEAKTIIENNPNMSKRSHNNVLLVNIDKPTEAVLNAYNKLISYDILIYQIEDPNKYFFVSDNPGYSIDISGNLHNVKFKDDWCHVIPLTSKITIFFRKPENENDEMKNIQWVTVHEEKIDLINFFSIEFMNELVCCENKSFLSNFINQIDVEKVNKLWKKN